MKVKNKNILVVGLGITGISSIKLLDSLDAKVYALDDRNLGEILEANKDLKTINFKYIEDRLNFDYSIFDHVIKSPGIKPESDILKILDSIQDKIITDLELAYQLAGHSDFIAITGTNGKTTTTSLIGEIIKKAGKNVFVTGNIGKPILDYVEVSNNQDIFLVEASSFQLNNIDKFKPKISLILNISPDHIDWHGNYKNYINAKNKIFENQTEEDITVLNYDDEELRKIERLKSKIIWFSKEKSLESGYYVEDGSIVEKIDGNIVRIIDLDEIKLPGKHNLENILASIAVTRSLGLDVDTIKKSIIEFKAIEHRLEYIGEINKIQFYNDSKGTNIESSIKAIEALNSPITLIAGGYDKNVEFDSFIKAFNGKVNKMIIMGETKDKLKAAALRQNFKNIYEVESMEEAVVLAYNISEANSSVLLSPACASWGMYKSFEHRGRDFKYNVDLLKED